MANEFSKASFVAARKLYFEQIAANSNVPIDGRINDGRLKRNSLSEGNIIEDNITTPFEIHSTMHKASSHSNLIPKKNELSQLFNSNSKIPIPESHSPLIKSINIDSESSVTTSTKITHHAMNKSSDKPNPENSPKIQILDEIPAAPPIKPAKITSPLLKNSRSSPLIISNSKLPIPTSVKNLQNENKQNKDLNKSNENNENSNNIENVNKEENKGWFSFTREKAPGWFAMAKEKVSTSANSWLSISRTKIEQMEEHKEWLAIANSYDEINSNNEVNNGTDDEIKINNRKNDNDDSSKENDSNKDSKEEKINIINSVRNNNESKKDNDIKFSKSSLSNELDLAVNEKQIINKNQLTSQSFSHIIPQERPRSPLRSISPTELRPQSPIRSLSPTELRPQSPIRSLSPTELRPQSPMRSLSPTELRSHSPIQRPITPTQMRPLSPAKIRVQSTSQPPNHIKAKIPTYIPSKVNTVVHNEQISNKNESFKEKSENTKISSTINEEIVRSPSGKSFNKIFNNTQNFMYKNNNLSFSNQSLNSTTSTNTEKLDESISTTTGDELIINNKDLASVTIAFDKKVLQKIDNSLPQERNDNELLNKIQRKKRISFGSSSLSKTIDEDDDDDNYSINRNFKNNNNEETNMNSKSEGMRDNPMYKYLRNKNDIIYQNFNTKLNRYEDDSDASYDSDGYISTDTESKKESFESKLRKKSKYFINGRKSSIGEKNSKIAVVSKNIKPSLPIPTLPVRKSSTTNLTKKLNQDSMKTSATKDKLNYKERPISPSHMGVTVSTSSPPMRSLSTSSNSSQVRATSPLTMYSRVNESLDINKKPKPYKTVKTEPIMIENKHEKPERILKYKPPRRTSSSLNRNNRHTRNKKSQDLSINELSSISIDSPPERGRSIFKEAREFSNKSHSIDTELSRRSNNRREGRNRSPDYRMGSGMNEKTRGRTRISIGRDMEDDDMPLIYSRNINTRKYLKKYLDRREGQRSQSVDASKTKSNNHRRNGSDEYLKIHDDEDSLYIAELLNSNIMDQDNDKENIFYTNKFTPKASSLRQEKYSSVISSSSSISSLSSTSSSASSMTSNSNTTNTTDINKSSSINNKTLINEAPVDSYYKISGVIKHSIIPIGNPSILYGGDESYHSIRAKNTLYNSRSLITLNRYNYQKSNRNSIQSNKRVSIASSNTNEDETSLIFGNLPEEVYNFFKPEVEVPPPTRTSSRESFQSSVTDSKRQSLSSLHQSLTLNDNSDNDEVTLRNNSTHLQASSIKEEEISKPMTKSQKRIEKITNEILSTERTYVNELRNLMTIYIEPLKKNHLLEQDEFNGVFANIEEIYNFHEKSFLPPLEAVCNSSDAKVSKFFLDISGSFENFYSKYYYAFNGANTLLTLVQSNNNHNVHIPSLSSSSYILNLPIFDRSNKKRLKKFKNFLKSCTARPDHTQLSLQGYLILPVQRLPRYLLLLEQLVKYSKDDPVEKEVNEKAAELMKNVVASCNSYMKQCEEKHILLEITTKHIRLDSNDSHGEMVDNYIKIQGLIRVPGAKVIRKGDLQILRSVTSDSSIFPCNDILNKRLSNDYHGRNPNLINPNIRCSSALSMATTTTNSSSRTYYDPMNNGSRLSSSNESIHSVSTNTTFVQPPASVNSNYKRSSTSVLDIKKNQTTDSIGMFYLIHNLFIYCKLNGILVNVLDLENATVEPASFSSTSSEFVEIESKKTDIVLIVSDSKTQLYLTSPDIDSVYSWHQTINKQWRALKKIEK
ncbi:hypothetical protein H8356DRAFT_1340029 [Neocallimastix lanati (nom. inval.)]|nr:hypothetical protein H8356DRAFT_1340029 [Neocallimastix sp. JGI-2020a]